MKPTSPYHTPELVQLEALIKKHQDLMRIDVVAEVQCLGAKLPVYVLELGSQDPGVPALGFFGGVHGNENIGARVVLESLASLLERLRWDKVARQMLKKMRLVFMPIVNPGGMYLQTRANPNGVDLMRSAPVEAEASVPFLLGGQRLTKHLPWYRGKKNQDWQPEAQALVKVVEERLLPHPFKMALDCHSGFGARDRIWFPWAKSKEPIPHVAEVYALRNLFRTAYPHHLHYKIEPQASSYTTSGDLWDYLYQRALELDNGPFLPLTLEMGSWLWVRKNPRQFFSRLGWFNPVVPHRRARILRQHLLWFDFLMHATRSSGKWLPKADDRARLEASAVDYWHSDDEDDES